MGEVNGYNAREAVLASELTEGTVNATEDDGRLVVTDATGLTEGTVNAKQVIDNGYNATVIVNAAGLTEGTVEAKEVETNGYIALVVATADSLVEGAGSPTEAVVNGYRATLLNGDIFSNGTETFYMNPLGSTMTNVTICQSVTDLDFTGGFDEEVVIKVTQPALNDYARIMSSSQDDSCYFHGPSSNLTSKLATITGTRPTLAIADYIGTHTIKRGYNATTGVHYLEWDGTRSEETLTPQAMSGTFKWMLGSQTLNQGNPNVEYISHTITTIADSKTYTTKPVSGVVSETGLTSTSFAINGSAITSRGANDLYTGAYYIPDDTTAPAKLFAGTDSSINLGFDEEIVCHFNRNDYTNPAYMRFTSSSNNDALYFEKSTTKIISKLNALTGTRPSISIGAMGIITSIKRGYSVATGVHYLEVNGTRVEVTDAVAGLGTPTYYYIGSEDSTQEPEICYYYSHKITNLSDSKIFQTEMVDGVITQLEETSASFEIEADFQKISDIPA